MNIATTPPRQGEDLLRPSRETDGGRTDLVFLDFTWSRRTLSQAGTPIRLTPKESLVLGLRYLCRLVNALDPVHRRSPLKA